MDYTKKAPGVYRQELDTLPPAVLRTGVPAFLGYTEYDRREVQHPADAYAPCRLTLWADFEQRFGPPLPDGYLAHAVRGFFENEGQLCYVVRLGAQWSDDPTERARELCRGLRALQAFGEIDLICAPDIMAGITENAALHDEALVLQGFILQHCCDLGDRFAILDSFYGADPDDVADQPNMLREQTQRCDMLKEPPGKAMAPEAEIGPEGGVPTEAPPQQAGEALPGPRTLRDVPRALRAAEMRGQEPWLPGNNAALYYPWIKVLDGPAITGGFVPPCGHVAGIYSQMDQRVGVHRAPANVVVAGALDLERDLTDEDQGPINYAGVNALRSFRGRGIRVWGARTLSPESAWRYVSVRRIFLTAVRWIERNMTQAAFEPNDANLWGRIERDLTVYFNGLYRQGALKGASPQEAFYVRCNKDTNPPELRDLGQVVTEIGLAPGLPNEFIVVRLVQSASGATIEGPTQIV